MSNITEFVLPEKNIQVNSSSFKSYRHYIDLIAEIPEGYDIKGTDFEYPDNLSSVLLELNGATVPFDITYLDEECFGMLKDFPIYLTSSKYTSIKLVFVYNKKWVESQEEFVYVNEYKEIEEKGEENVTIFDGHEYHTGTVIHKNMVPTGNTVKKVTRGVDVTIPKITFILTEKEQRNNPFAIPFKQKIHLKNFDDKKYYEKYKRNLIENYGFEEIDEDRGYITNEMRYIHGHVGVKYDFTIHNKDD